MRRKDAATRGGAPAGWDKFCADEVAAALALSRRAAERMVPLERDLATRLPLTRAALAAGIIGDYKALLIAEATRVLDGKAAADAEAAVVPDGVTGKTPAQIRAAIGRAVLKADPDAARRPREEAEKDPRVDLWREDAGTAAICGYGLPPDAALAAGQAITATALDLKAAGLPGTMDQLRARAYLDALLGQDSRPTAPQPASPQTPSPQTPARPLPARSPPARSPASTAPASTEPASAALAATGPASAEAARPESSGAEAEAKAASADGPGGGPASGNDHAGEDDAAGGNGPAGPSDPAGPDGAGGPGGRPAGPAGRAGTGPPPPAAAINLTIPLTTLPGLTDHPGEAAAFGPLDAGLARTMAAYAAASPATSWCLTVTDEHGHPTAHGCAKPARPGRRGTRQQPNRPSGRPPGNHSGPADADGAPPRTSTSPPGTGSGAPGGYGSWRLRLPGRTRDLTAALEPLAVTECDHRHQTTAHDPGRLLRHLTEIRDGACTYPPCLRDARRCDFEHAIPWPRSS